jgi:U3 small nucleolar RNA-associated protein 19
MVNVLMCISDAADSEIDCTKQARMRPTKRRKVDESQEKIVKLEEDLTAAIQDGSSLNALADLVAEAKKSTNQPQRLHKALYALYRVFSLLISEDRLLSPRLPSEQDVVVRTWLLQRLDQYLNFLSTLFESSEPLISVCSLFDMDLPLTL